MKNWFFSMQARERIFVATATIFIVFALIWFGGWKPLDARHTAAAARVTTWQQSINSLRPMRGQLQAMSSGQPISTGQNESLVIIIDNSLRQRGLHSALQRSQPTLGGNGIRVEFESAAFDDLMLWIGDLHRQYGLQVVSGNFSTASSDTPGRVNSSVTLER